MDLITLTVQRSTTNLRRLEPASTSETGPSPDCGISIPSVTEGVIGEFKSRVVFQAGYSHQVSFNPECSGLGGNFGLP